MNANFSIVHINILFEHILSIWLTWLSVQFSSRYSASQILVINLDFIIHSDLEATLDLLEHAKYVRMPNLKVTEIQI